MSVINQNLLLTPEGYQISRSVRLRSSASAYFNRTPASASNRKTWTWSGWVKRGTLGSASIQSVFSAGANASYPLVSLFFFNDSIDFYADAAGTGTRIRTTAVYRDPSAWYHIVIACDTTQAIAANRMLLYVNGVQVTSFSTNNPPAQNADLSVNNTVPHFHGAYAYDTTTNRFDGYLTEVNFIDGQALTPSSFGETNPVTGVWQPKKYAGTYGTNGFYLNFSDNSAATAAAIGKDSSGNGNNWTPNNISVTAGVTYDSMLDVPTMWSDGGNGRGNYAVLNPILSASLYNAVLSNANLTATLTATTQINTLSNIPIPQSGKWYAEVQVVNASAYGVAVGIAQSPITAAAGVFGTPAVSYYNVNGNKYVNGTATAYGTSWGSGTNTIGMAVDSGAGTITFYLNNVSQGSISITTGVDWYLGGTHGSGSGSHTENWNFGQQPFSYTPPTGFKALNTQNLPDSLIVKGSTAFNISLDTGANIKTSTEALFGTSYLEWIKDRATANNHQLIDTVRGTSAVLQSNTTAAETTYTAPSGNSVGWAWKKGATQGFDIVTYTGNGTSGRTLAHSLGVAPAMTFVKRRDTTAYWAVWHKNLTSYAYELYLNTTDSQALDNSFTAAPSSTVLTLGSGAINNASGGTYVAYLFAEVAGFSKFGSYTGNGSADGPFVYTGFRPKFVMMKCSSTGGSGYSWFMRDSARDTYNAMPNSLFSDSSTSELSNANYNLDFVSNGFKIRGIDAGVNASSQTYIYMAFAENPFRNSLAR